jgi:hypothetical protein
MPLLVLSVVAFTTLGVMVVLAVALVRHLKLLAAAAAAFRDQAQPILEDITSGAAAAQERLDRMSRRAAIRKR